MIQSPYWDRKRHEASVWSAGRTHLYPIRKGRERKRERPSGRREEETWYNPWNWTVSRRADERRPKEAETVLAEVGRKKERERERERSARIHTRVSPVPAHAHTDTYTHTHSLSTHAHTTFPYTLPYTLHTHTHTHTHDTTTTSTAIIPTPQNRLQLQFPFSFQTGSRGLRLRVPGASCLFC